MRSSAPASPRSCSTSRPSPRSMCAAAAPGTRETDLLDPAQTVERIDAIALSGGSAFGLDAASGVQAWLREQGRGFAVRHARVPIVPGAILFDLLNGGDKDWGRYPPYRELGYAAARRRRPRLRARQRRRGLRRDHRQPQGRARLGLGADARRHDRRRAGRGQCRRQRHDRRRAAFLGGAVRAGRRIRRARPARVRAAAGARPSAPRAAPARTPRSPWSRPTRPDQGAGQAPRRSWRRRLARAIYPVHTPLDGDVVFAAATGARAASPIRSSPGRARRARRQRWRPRDRARRVRGAALPFPGALPSWRDKFGVSATAERAQKRSAG